MFYLIPDNMTLETTRHSNTLHPNIQLIELYRIGFRSIKVIIDMHSTHNRYEELRLDRIFRYPASYQEALIHRDANKFGYNSARMKDGTDTPICPCCEIYINTMEIPLDYPTLPNRAPSPEDPVFLLPANICLYFTFVKMVIGFILMRFVIVDLYNLVTSLNGRYCSLLGGKSSSLNEVCTSFIISVLSGYNKHSSHNREAMVRLSLLGFIFVVVSIVYLIWYQFYSYRLYYFLENNDVSEDDFTILVENVPSIIFNAEHATVHQSSFNYRDFIKNQVELKVKAWIDNINAKAYKRELDRLPYLENHFYEAVISKQKPEVFKKRPIVHSVTICYDLTEIQNLNRIRNGLIDDFLRKVDKKEQQPSQDNLIEFIPNQIRMLNSRYIQLCHLIGKDTHPSFTLSHFVGRAFVTFEYQHYRDYFLRQYQRTSNFLVFNQEKQARISRAPKPNDVFWHHMKVSDVYRLKNTFYSYLIMAMGLVFSLGGLIGLKIWRQHLSVQTHKQSFHDKLLTLLFHVLMAGLTYVINVLLGLGLQRLTEMEKHQCQTGRISSLILKNSIAKFLNTTVIYFIFHKMNPVPFLSSQGLVSRILGLISFSVLMKIGMDLLPIQSYIVDLVNRYRYQSNKKINLFQVQLNQKLELKQFNLVNQYSYYLHLVYLISFYAMLVPLSVPILLVAFCLQYWVDKYVLFKRLSSPVDFGYQLTKLIIKCFQCSLLVFTIGNLYWDEKISRKTSRFSNSVNILSLAITVIYLLISLFCPRYIKESILGKIMRENLYSHSYSYYYKANKFLKLYWRQNPASAFLNKSDESESSFVLRSAKRQNSKASEFVSQKDVDRYINNSRSEVYISRCGSQQNIEKDESSYSSGRQSN